MNIKFWKKHGGYVLVENIWHMESALYFIRFYTTDDREFEIYFARNEDGTYNTDYAYLIERQMIRDYEHDDWIQKILSKTKVQGWIAVHSDKEMEELF